MGKGSRNRALHQQEAGERSQRNQSKQAPQWVLPLIILVLVVAILAVPVTMAISGTGIVERNRILIKSQTGKFDLSQSMATYMAWQILLEYSNASWDSIKSTTVSGTSYTFLQYYQSQYGSDADVATYFAIDNAGAIVKSDLRSCIEPYMTDYMAYVAVCDAAYKANVSLSDAELSSVDAAIEELKGIYSSLGYGSFNKFLSAKVYEGIKEKDIRASLEMKLLYDKYKEQMQLGYEAEMTAEKILTYRDAHPEKYYKTDYLSSKTDSKELAEKLLTAKTAKEFKEILIQNEFDTNYQKLFATYSAKAVYSALGGATNSENGNALTDALDKQDFPEADTYTEGDISDESLKKWLFTSGTVGTATQISTENGIYIAALLARNTEEKTVEARFRFFEFSSNGLEGTSYEGDTEFKNSVLDTFFAEKYAEMLLGELQLTDANIEQILKDNNAIEWNGITRETQDLPAAIATQVFDMGNKAGSVCEGFSNGIYYVIYIRSCESTGSGTAFQVTKADISYCAYGKGVENYLSAAEKQDALANELKAENADKEAIMRAQDAIESKDITASTSSSVVPSAVTKIVFNDVSSLAIGDVYTTNSNGTYYVIYVTALGTNGSSASILYKEFEHDFFYQITNGLISGLSENTVYPTVKSTVSYSPNASENTFAEWVSQVQAGTLTSLRKEFDTNMFEGKDDDGNTVYTAYILINTPMYFDTYKVVNGAYLRVSDSSEKGDFLEKLTSFEQQLAAAKAEGKTGSELTDLLYSLSVAAQIDEDFSKSAIPNEDLAEWMFSDERVADDIKTILVKDSSFAYIGIYLSSGSAWEVKAKNDCINTMTEEWIASLTESYTVNEKALNKIGDPTTAATTTATTAK